YDWNTSSGDWDKSTKIKRWAFTTSGDKEVWVEVKDGGGSTATCYANIFVHPGYAIIVAGQGRWVPGDKHAIDHAANNAYRVLRNLGFDDDHIFYLNSKRPQDVDEDKDKDNEPDEVDDYALFSVFKSTINEIKNKIMDRPIPLILYIVGHGHIDFFEFDSRVGEEGFLWVSYSNPLGLKEMLDDFSSETPMLIVIGSCYSGSFITSTKESPGSISAQNKIIITAAHDDLPFGVVPYFDWSWSSDRFWGNLNQGLVVKEAFVKNFTASDATFRWLDDNGDKKAHGPLYLGDDGKLAATTQIGIPGVEMLALTPWYLVWKRSPGELRVYDSLNRVTGLVNGEVREEIPNSSYDRKNEMVAIFSPSDTYRYDVVGTDEGTYGLEIVSIKGNEAITFTATDIPTSSEAIHQYTIDWDVLSQNKEGVTVQVDSDGDGIFEQTIVSDNELTQDEFITATAIPGDFDKDGDVDQNDLNILLSYRNKPASNCPQCDLDGDSKITVLDARKLVLLCTRPRCAR
ncbi:MAG: hypothetical protein AB1478_06505, partial [Nitrospirota bacterium]